MYTSETTGTGPVVVSYMSTPVRGGLLCVLLRKTPVRGGLLCGQQVERDRGPGFGFLLKYQVSPWQTLRPRTMGGNRGPVMRNRVKRVLMMCRRWKHRWFRDHIKTDRWERITGVFPQGGNYSPKHKWVLMTEDTKSLVPYRYQQYGITVKLNPDKEDKLHSTFGNLSKTYPTLWISCSHYNCMLVYDVTNLNDTQRNFHLTDHHTLGVKTFHGHKTLHTVRQGFLSERNDYVLSRNMTMTLLTQLRVTVISSERCVLFFGSCWSGQVRPPIRPESCCPDTCASQYWSLDKQSQLPKVSGRVHLLESRHIREPYNGTETRREIWIRTSSSRKKRHQ